MMLWVWCYLVAFVTVFFIPPQKKEKFLRWILRIK